MEFVETEKRSESIARINSLAAASACGDKQALIDLIGRLDPLFRKYAGSFSQCGEPEDVYQDIVVYLIEFIRSHDVHKIKNFAGYFKMSLINRLSEKQRQIKKSDLLKDLRAEDILTETASPSAEETALQKSRLSRADILNCMHMMKELSNLDRDLIFLRDCGHAPGLCASILGVNINTVYYRLRRLGTIVRNLLKNGDFENMPCADIYCDYEDREGYEDHSS